MSSLKSNKINAIKYTRNLLKAPVLLIAISALGGCGVSKTPSASDIKSQLQEAFKECKPMQVANVEKINGVDLGNGLYRVSTKFTFVTTPIPEAGKIVEAAEARKAELKSEIERVTEPSEARYKELEQERNMSRVQCDQRLDDLEKQARATARTIADRLTAEGKKGLRQDPEIIALQEAYDKERGSISQQCNDASDQKNREMESISFKLKSLNSEYNSLDFDVNGNLIGDTSAPGIKIQEILGKKCRFPGGIVLIEIFRGVYKTYAPALKKAEMEFSGDIPMMKTDNGWIISGIHK